MHTPNVEPTKKKDTQLVRKFQVKEKGAQVKKELQTGRRKETIGKIEVCSYLKTTST